MFSNSSILELAYLNRAALHNLTPSIIDAWFNWSEIIASSLSSNVSNNPPFASKHELYKIVSSLSKKDDTFCSSSLWIFWVPHINLTELNPKPYSEIPFFAASIILESLDKPR